MNIDNEQLAWMEGKLLGIAAALEQQDQTYISCALIDIAERLQDARKPSLIDMIIQAEALNPRLHTHVRHPENNTWLKLDSATVDGDYVHVGYRLDDGDPPSDLRSRDLRFDAQEYVKVRING